MIPEETFAKIKKFAERHLQDDKDAAHNMEHVMRVYNIAIKLAKNEEADLDVIKIAVFLHDIGGSAEENDRTGKADHAKISAELAKPFLEKLNIPESQINHIVECILSHRYRTESKPKTKEAMIVFDADKLETVGAIGVARMFSWVGKYNAHIYKKMDIKEYAEENLSNGKQNGRIIDKTKHSPQLNYETKDKHILDYLYTERAKQIAKERLDFYKMFLAKLEEEIQGLN